MRRILLYFSLLIFAGCAYIDRSHPYNAMPSTGGKLTLNHGITWTNGFYDLHEYEPADLDSLIRGKHREVTSGQTVTGLNIGLGDGLSLGLGGSITGLSPRFQGRGFDDWGGFSNSYFCKAYLKKSLELENDSYLAVFPALTYGEGVEYAFPHVRARYEYKSLELPITVSKAIEFGKRKQCIVSGTARAARDWIQGDLNVASGTPFGYDDYPISPDIQMDRLAAMGMLELKLNQFRYFLIQAGYEYIHTDTGQTWKPIFYLGYKMHLKRNWRP